MVALGTDVAGLMSNDDAWGGRVLAAARRAGERAWQLPMWPHYGELIKSDVADFKNTGGTRYGGAITAAKLLEQFVGDVPWAHLDIAGVMDSDADDGIFSKGSTAYGVRLFADLLTHYSPPR
jgi:leucyl aminopeptidase